MRGVKRTLSGDEIVISPCTAKINLLSCICIPRFIRWQLKETTEHARVYHTRVTAETEIVSYVDRHYQTTRGLSNVRLVCETLDRACIPRLVDPLPSIKWWYSLSPQNWEQQGVHTAVDVCVYMAGLD
jgi:hypothetical protein